MNTLIFDIETVPDVESGRMLLGLENLNDNDIAEAMFKLRREENGTDFLRLHLQRIVAISAVLHNHKQLKVWSIGDEDASEAEIIQRFFDGIDRFTPTLVSWNGSGFDLPALHYRMLLHGVQAPRYWETGGDDQSFKWNNYLNRYHDRHLDLMDVLAGYQGRANAPLDQIATILGFPGKMGMDGSKVWPEFQAGNIKAIRNYCETDVLNTFLVYLRFQLIRGRYTAEEYELECQRVRDMLTQSDEEHMAEFLGNWNKSALEISVS